MPSISKEKRDKISEQILYYLFTISPNSAFTSYISAEIARDEEFTKSLLLELKGKKLVVEVNKNSQGFQYIKRQRWRISDQAYDIYKKHQQKSQISANSELLQ